MSDTVHTPEKHPKKQLLKQKLAQAKADLTTIKNNSITNQADAKAAIERASEILLHLIEYIEEQRL